MLESPIRLILDAERDQTSPEENKHNIFNGVSPKLEFLFRYKIYAKA